MLYDKKGDDFSLQIAKKILSIAASRGTGKSTCPSEVARVLFPEDWRKHMKSVVELAIDLQGRGKVVLTQRGQPVDVNQIKGPIRIKMV